MTTASPGRVAAPPVQAGGDLPRVTPGGRAGLPLRVFLVRLIWCCMAPLLLPAAWLAIDQMRQIEQRRELDMARLVQAVQVAVDLDLRARIGALQMLAASPLVDDSLHRAEFHREAQAFERSFGSHVVLADQAGHMLLNTRVAYGTPMPPMARSQGHAAVLQALASGRPAVGDLFIGPIAGQALLGVAVPVLRDGPARLVLVTTFEARQLSAHLDRIDLPAGWAMALLDGSGADIARRGPALTPTPGQGGASPVDAGLPGADSGAPSGPVAPPAATATPAAPDWRLVAASTLSPWSVVLTIQPDVLRAPLPAAAAALVLAIVAATLAGLLGGSLATRRLGSDMAALARSDTIGTASAQHIEEIAAVQRRLDEAAARHNSAAAELRQSEQRLHRLFADAPLPLALIDAQGAVADLNTRFVQTFGYTQADLPTLAQWWPLAYPDETYRRDVQQVWSAATAHAFASGADIEAQEVRIACRSGERRTMVVSGIVIGSDLLCTFFDITERQQAELALRTHQAAALEAQQQARLAALNLMEDAQAARARAEAANTALRELSLAVEQSPGSIMITDLEARIQYVNEAFVRTTGYRRDEVIGRNPKLLRSPETPASRHAAMWQQLKRGETWQGEFVNLRKDGSRCVEFAVITPLRQDDGRISRYVAVMEDITERKRMGAELERHRHDLEELVASCTAELEAARSQADAANLATSTFLAHMSHQIRTQMNAIIGLTQLLRRDTQDPVAAKRLAKVGDTADHLLEDINDILDLSKIEAGQVELEQARFSLGELLARAAGLVAERAQAQGLALHVEPIDGPDALFGDPTRLLQALLNLLGNAVKFTDAGRIQLRAGLLERRGARVKLRLSVHHSGIGVPPERQASLLSAFVQADSSMTRRFGGTGQCLVITQRLARLMGGSAGMNSTPGVGSEFWLTVWLDQAPADMVAVDRPRASDADVDLGAGAAGAHRRRADLPQYSVVHSGPHCEAGLRRDHAGAAVLLVEDNPINQEVTLEMLRSVALDVDLASNGAEALQAIERRRYAVVLMNMQMPVMDGLEATRRLRSLACHDDLPVLAMTANAYDEDREACLGAGMDGHVAQPVDRQRLFATVLHWLDQGRLRANKPA